VFDEPGKVLLSTHRNDVLRYVWATGFLGSNRIARFEDKDSMRGIRVVEGLFINLVFSDVLSSREPIRRS
jgi:hypothetical protein